LMILMMVKREMRVACLEDAYFFKRLDMSFMLLKSRSVSLYVLSLLFDISLRNDSHFVLVAAI
jgi:hypothetical protein